MRVVGYARLSRATREESTSITRQREVIERTAEARGFELVETVVDDNVSATKTRLDRPGLRRVRELIAADQADAVVVWRLDRLVRSVVDVGVLLDEGLHIISATESLDTTSPMGRAMVEILQVFASMEATTIGLRVSASQEHLRKVGRFPGGVVPYGYRAVPHPSGVGRALEPHPDEAAVVRRLADGVLAGRSVYAMTVELNAEGIPPRRPLRKLEDGSVVRRQWGPSTIQRILRSDAVLGRVRTGSVRAPHPVTGKPHIVKPAELIRNENGLPVVFWEPLLSVTDVLALRRITEWTPTPGRAEATARGRRTKATRLLSGLLTCHGCGGTLIAKSRRSTTGRDIYACHASAQGRTCPRGVAVECHRVEEEVERLFLAVVGRIPFVEARTVERDVSGLAHVEEALRDTTDALRAPGADVAALVSRLERLHAERDRLDAQPAEPDVELVETGESFSAAWARLSPLERRRMLLSAGAEIGLAPARQRGKWDPSRVSLTLRR